MAYADPQSTSNPTTGQPILAAWGDVVRDDLEYLARNFPHCSIYESTAQSVANDTNAALTSNEERSDVGGMHSTVSNTSRITVPAGEGGLYRLSAVVTYAANATGQRLLQFWKNGSLLIELVQADAAAAGNTVFSGSFPAVLAAGDYVECYVRQSSGGALNVTLNDFSAEWRAVA